MTMRWYVALVHGPVRSKTGEEVTTSVTNLDIHDISRTCRTFGMERYYLITPIQKQQALVKEILGHWETDTASQYNPDRSEALGYASVLSTLADVVADIEAKEGQKPLIVVTGANFKKYDGQERELIQRIRLDGKPMLLLFGTGWGLTASMVEQADYRLEPIFGRASDNYNHLSVRSAVAIYCDRLARSL